MPDQLNFSARSLTLDQMVDRFKNSDDVIEGKIGKDGGFALYQGSLFRGGKTNHTEERGALSRLFNSGPTKAEHRAQAKDFLFQAIENQYGGEKAAQVFEKFNLFDSDKVVNGSLLMDIADQLRPPGDEQAPDDQGVGTPPGSHTSHSDPSLQDASRSSDVSKSGSTDAESRPVDSSDVESQGQLGNDTRRLLQEMKGELERLKAFNEGLESRLAAADERGQRLADELAAAKDQIAQLQAQLRGRDESEPVIELGPVAREQGDEIVPESPRPLRPRSFSSPTGGQETTTVQIRNFNATQAERFVDKMKLGDLMKQALGDEAPRFSVSDASSLAKRDQLIDRIRQAITDFGKKVHVPSGVGDGLDGRFMALVETKSPEMIAIDAIKAFFAEH